MYIAFDADGVIYGHENEPSASVDRWVSTGRKQEITAFEAVNKSLWKSSLVKKSEHLYAVPNNN